MGTEGIPVIDLADPEAPGTVRAIGVACRDWGFFQAVGHGVEARLIASVQRVMRAFFARDSISVTICVVLIRLLLCAFVHIVKCILA